MKMNKIKVFDDCCANISIWDRKDCFRIAFGINFYFFPKKEPFIIENMIKRSNYRLNKARKRGEIYLTKEIIEMFEGNDLLNKQLAFEIIKIKINKLK